MSLKKKDPKVAVKATAAAAQEKANDELAEAATAQAEADAAQEKANEELAEASEAQAEADAAKKAQVDAEAAKKAQVDAEAAKKAQVDAEAAKKAEQQGIPNDTVIRVMNNGAHNLHDSLSKITYRAKTLTEKGVMTSWLRAQVRAENFSVLPKVAE